MWRKLYGRENFQVPIQFIHKQITKSKEGFQEFLHRHEGLCTIKETHHVTVTVCIVPSASHVHSTRKRDPSWPILHHAAQFVSQPVS